MLLKASKELVILSKDWTKNNRQLYRPYDFLVFLSLNPLEAVPYMMTRMMYKGQIPSPLNEPDEDLHQSFSCTSAPGPRFDCKISEPILMCFLADNSEW